jgi:hypothetical protein
MIPDRLLKILRSCETDEASQFPPTEVYNEGWMLRLVLDAAQEVELRGHPLEFYPDARWYSEALLNSAFLPRARADALAEGFTHADGIVGSNLLRPRQPVSGSGPMQLSSLSLKRRCSATCLAARQELRCTIRLRGMWPAWRKRFSARNKVSTHFTASVSSSLRQSNGSEAESTPILKAA